MISVQPYLNNILKHDQLLLIIIKFSKEPLRPTSLSWGKQN